MRFDSYQTGGFFDEMFDAEGKPRPEAKPVETIEATDSEQLLRCQQATDQLLLQMGITFNVYGDKAGTEKIFPFDLIPRIVLAKEWEWLERGLRQRVHALNEFLDDIYHDQKIPERQGDPGGHQHSAASYRPQMV